MQKRIDNQIRISVRSLVEFVLRTGDLDNRRGRNSKDAMAEGSRIHRKIQKEMGPGYRAEVSLKKQISCGEFCLQLEGRADGIFTDDDGIETIDEIKGIYQDLKKMEDPIPVHQAQAVCYGYLYASEKNLPGMNIQITYCNLESEEIRRFIRFYSFCELEEAVHSLTEDYAKWGHFLLEHRKLVQKTVPGLQFPYPYREGQRDLVVSVYRTISRRKRLFIQAPTGIGKTLSAVFPAVKALGEGLAEKIFYLTAKTITRSVAEDAFRVLAQTPSEQGPFCVSSVTLTAKEKMCPMLSDGGRPECNPDACPYAKGHFDRVNQAVYALITHRTQILREDILEYAKEYRVCPFEMSLDVTDWTDAIICDYNYVFDPNVRLQRYFADGTQGEYLFLIDEAHNLVDRARQMYSAVLYKDDFLESARHYAARGKKLSSRLKRCNALLLDFKRRCSGVELLSEEEISVLAEAVDRLYAEISAYYEDHPAVSMEDAEADFFFRLRDFLLTYERLDENYQIYTELQEDGSFQLKLFCINTAKNLRRCLDQGSAAIFYSATLLPVRYYKSLLSGEEEDYAVYANSPFDPQNRLLCIGRDVTSRYSSRDAAGFHKAAEYILEIVSCRTGNYMVFCPSYAYLQQVETAMERCLAENPPEILPEIRVQEVHMTEQKREEFLSAFSQNGSRSLIGLCIMGGIFSEGIDLREDRLIGVIVIGTGLPQICTEREILKGYYERSGKDGFAYAYLYPGMNKVQQAAGRLIRTQEDRGVLFLLDYRFLNREYREQFPREWSDYRVVRLNDVRETTKYFWEHSQKQRPDPVSGLLSEKKPDC